MNPPPPPVLIESPLRKKQMLEFRNESEKKRKDEEERKRKMVEIDFERVFTPFDISCQIDWDGIKAAAVSSSDSGRDGVFFLQTGDDKIFVLKGSMFLADEVFSSRISHLFRIRTPKTDIIEYKPKDLSVRHKAIAKYGNDWYGAKVALQRIGKNGNNRVKFKLDRNLYRAFYILMEFVPGYDMFSKKFESEKIFKSKKHLNDLGRIFVFDLIQNNSDRFPVPGFFEHEGNAGNFLFMENGTVAIDQCVSPFVTEEKKENYKLEVKKFVETHKSGDLEKNVYLLKIVDFIKLNTAFELQKDQLLEIWRGMDDVLKIVSEGRITLQILREIKKEVESLVTGVDWENVYADSAKKIDVDFIFEVMNVMKVTYEEQ